MLAEICLCFAVSAGLTDLKVENLGKMTYITGLVSHSFETGIPQMIELIVSTHVLINCLTPYS